MSDLQGVFLAEVQEQFGVHRVIPDDRGRGVAIHHVDGSLHYADLRFADQGGKVYVDCYLLNRRYQECHELADPESVEKILDLVRRHLAREIPRSSYS